MWYLATSLGAICIVLMLILSNKRMRILVEKNKFLCFALLVLCIIYDLIYFVYFVR